MLTFVLLALTHGAAANRDHTLPTLEWSDIEPFRYSQQRFGLRIWSLAFPTLFPTGKADWCTPRPRSLTFIEWARHLLRFHDGRFARHARFRYAVFNQWMRDKAGSRARWTTRKAEASAVGPTKDDLLDAFSNDTEQAQALLNSCIRTAGAILGSRPFWSRKCRELTAFVHSLGTPTFFFTFSAADTQWYSVNRLFPRFDEWQAGDDKARYNLNRDNLRDNPHIATWHFHDRFRWFLHEVLIPKFGVEDYWFRYEFQGRGSTHVHGFVWARGNGVPNVDDLNFELQPHRDLLVAYWSRHIHAVNPEPDRRAPPPGSRSTINLGPAEVQNTVCHLSDVT